MTATSADPARQGPEHAHCSQRGGNDARTGDRRWEAAFTQASDTYAVRILDGVVTGVTGTGPAPNDIRAFDVATGQPLWTKPAFPVQTPEPTDGNIYVTTADDGAFGALGPKSGELR